MRASVSALLTEAHQEADLAVLLMPEVTFLALGCFLLPATRISLVRNSGFGFGLMRFGLAASFALSFLFACLFLELRSLFFVSLQNDFWLPCKKLCSDSVLSLASTCSLCEDLHLTATTIVESVSCSLPGTPC